MLFGNLTAFLSFSNFIMRESHFVFPYVPFAPSSGWRVQELPVGPEIDFMDDEVLNAFFPVFLDYFRGGEMRIS